MKDSEAWHAVVHGLTKIQTRLRELATEQQLIKLKKKKKMESNLESSLIKLKKKKKWKAILKVP